MPRTLVFISRASIRLTARLTGTEMMVKIDVTFNACQKSSSLPNARMLSSPTKRGGRIRFQSVKVSQTAVKAGSRNQIRNPRMKGMIKRYPVTVRRWIFVLGRRGLKSRLVDDIPFLQRHGATSVGTSPQM